MKFNQKVNTIKKFWVLSLTKKKKWKTWSFIYKLICLSCANIKYVKTWFNLFLKAINIKLTVLELLIAVIYFPEIESFFRLKLS